MLTAAHVVEAAVSVQVRFDADLPGEWITEAISCWTDPDSDLAVLTITPHEGEPRVTVARFGRIGGDRAAVLTVRAVGFPRFKLKTDNGDRSVYRDSHQADGSVAVLSNRREGTLEVTVPPPERDPDPGVSPWEGMSGAVVWVGDRIVGVVAKHHRCDGLGRLAATRLELALAGLDAGRRAELQGLIDLPDVLPGLVPPSAGEWVTTAYQAQVRDIAPDQLLDREAELNELVGFCAGDQPYAWWQAEPWAGKSALMAWFVLHPPAGVDVVSFFVTARLAGQSDSHACTDALIEQLAALVGESPAGLLTAGARRGTMLRLLDDAAKRSREAGRRLLLVIDGLDEDSRTTTGPSIAALLPRRLPAEVRVLVASRPHPPIPDDVTGDHPLRTISPRQLNVSEHARDVEGRANHELTQLLAGTQLQRDVLGLITAAGGGLTLGDLEELTKQPPYEIKGLLGGIFGRSVGTRTGTPTSGRPGERVYLFTHETLRLVAVQSFGKSLASHRDWLHCWADTYRQRGWPTDTPQYLLRSYPRMLASIADLARLVACATDQARHDRMRSLTGGDALALIEISTAQQLLLAPPDPDLTSLVLIAVQREHLKRRNYGIPNNLPAVWARLGQLTRAEALTHSILYPPRRAEVLGRLATAVAASGDHDRATQLANDAEALIAQITGPQSRATALGQLATAVAASGDHKRATQLANDAEALIAQITETDSRAEALGKLAASVAARGDHDRAMQLVDETVALITQITNPNLPPERYSRDRALRWLATAVTASGDHNRAEVLIAQITDFSPRVEALGQLAAAVAMNGDHNRAEALIAPIIIGQQHRAEALAQLAEALAARGDHDRAMQLVDETVALIAQITDRAWQDSALRQLIQAVAASGDLDRAEALITQINIMNSRTKALSWLAEAVAVSGDHDRATRLANEVEALIAQITEPDWQDRALRKLAQAVAVSGDHDRAEALITQITFLYWRVEQLGWLVEAVAASGDLGRATRLANEAEALMAPIKHESYLATTLGQLAGAVAVSGDHDRAEALITQITDLSYRAEAWNRLTAAVAANGDHDQIAWLANIAEAFITQITDPYSRAKALSRLVEVVAASGDDDQVARLAGEAETFIAQIISPSWRAEALSRLATAVVASGGHDWATRLANEAEALITQINHLPSQAEQLGRLVEVVAASGDHNRAARVANDAEVLIAQITDPYQRAEAFGHLAISISRAYETTPTVREHPLSRSPMLVRARHLLGEALASDSWTCVASSLARLDPPAVSALADELQVRWKLNAPTDTREHKDR